jgi:hypothetical protein
MALKPKRISLVFLISLWNMTSHGRSEVSAARPIPETDQLSRDEIAESELRDECRTDAL